MNGLPYLRDQLEQPNREPDPIHLGAAEAASKGNCYHMPRGLRAMPKGMAWASIPIQATTRMQFSGR